MRALTFVPHYLPGYRAGGPLRSVSNLVDRLGDDVDFRIVTADRDAEDDAPFAEVAVDAWNEVGGAQVFYASPGTLTLRRIAELWRELTPDIVYLNSFFHPVFTVRPLLVRRFGRVPSAPTIIAPKGQFSAGALTLKAWKKRPFVGLAKLSRLYSGLLWQASSEHEAADIRHVMDVRGDEIVIAPDLPGTPSGAETPGRHREPGEPLRVIFLSRVTRKKNLDFALRTLAQVRVPTELTIVGPVRDEAYWAQCQALIRSLPEHVRVSSLGSVEHESVERLMADHDLFFLPTRGENFGHVIPEALSAGTPVLIADTTPWRGLDAAGVGWDLPLADEAGFVAAIEYAAAVPASEYAEWRQRARDYAAEGFSASDDVEANRRLFMDAVAREGRAEGIEDPCLE